MPSPCFGSTAGDGHIAALLLADLDPVEVLVTHAATGDVAADVLRATRAWPAEDWDAGVERLRSRGLLQPAGDLAVTDEGRRLRQQIEDSTDARAAPAYESLGSEGCERLRRLGRPISLAVVGAGLITVHPDASPSEPRGASDNDRLRRHGRCSGGWAEVRSQLRLEDLAAGVSG